MASVGAALAVVFTVGLVAPVSAQAYGGSNYGGGNYSHIYSTPSYYISGNNNNYGYSYSRPIVISEPPQIVYQQPQVVYQQPQVIYQQSQPVVYQQQSYSPLTVSCYASSQTVSTGQSVTWTAYVSGGTNSYNNYNNYNYNSSSYSYTWSGTNGSSYTNSSTAYSTYYTPGSYSASVTVYGNGQSVTQSCGYVTVSGSYGYNYNTPTYAYNYPTTYTSIVPNETNSGNLVAACFADRTTAAVGTPVTWAVEVTGAAGQGQYTYSWSGSDGLAGTGASAVQSYSTPGQKNATVLISSGGQTISQACGDSVNVKAYVSPAETNYQGPAVNSATSSNSTSQNSLSAAALLGLANIPWGWIAILIIIILGVTVFYLLFNRHKV